MNTHSKENIRESTTTDSCCSTASSCCGSDSQQNHAERVEKMPESGAEWICGFLETPSGNVPKVSTEWTRSDYWGEIKARMSSFRMRYSILPGLYAVGEPDEHSDVFVSANYKLSFDILRRELTGMNCWILVLDTKGINVWCAAGKGTFGTKELVKQIIVTQLKKIVCHKWIIVPQLGAPGVNVTVVQKRTKFKVLFGPVHAKDIPAYIREDYQASQELRTIRFPLRDRLVLTPMEVNPMLKKFPIYGLIVLLIFGLQSSGILFRDAWNGGLPFLLLGLISIFAGAFLTPAFLPVIPSPSFAIKGWLVGIVVMFLSQLTPICHIASTSLTIMAYLFFPLLTSYIALQFTGSTTFTGISGVRKELKFAIPVYIAGGVISLIFLIIYKLGQWRIL